jgi:hypothetical protein
MYNRNRVRQIIILVCCVFVTIQTVFAVSEHVLLTSELATFSNAVNNNQTDLADDRDFYFKSASTAALKNSESEYIKQLNLSRSYFLYGKAIYNVYSLAKIGQMTIEEAGFTLDELKDQALGKFKAGKSYAEVAISLNPTADAYTIRAWNNVYACLSADDSYVQKNGPDTKNSLIKAISADPLDGDPAVLLYMLTIYDEKSSESQKKIMAVGIEKLLERKDFRFETETRFNACLAIAYAYQKIDPEKALSNLHKCEMFYANNKGVQILINKITASLQ